MGLKGGYGSEVVHKRWWIKSDQNGIERACRRLLPGLAIQDKIRPKWD